MINETDPKVRQKRPKSSHSTDKPSFAQDLLVSVFGCMLYLFWMRRDSLFLNYLLGTYVDKNILPGFQYKVRKNLANEYFFDGKAKYLDSIGLGYGKRITFEGATLNENENYFWSDSCIHGYGFTLQTISEEDNYNIFDTNTGKVIGRIFINNPSLTDDTVLSTAVGEWGYIKKEVEVLFSCDVILNDSANHQNIYVEDVPVRGKAIAVRENWSSKAKVNQIFLHDFLINNCLLLPEE